MTTQDPSLQDMHNVDAVTVNWFKTWVAWLITSALVLFFRILVMPSNSDLRDWGIIILMSLTWLAATIMMAVTQIGLHSVRCLRLRHYILSYPIIVSPILLNALVEGYFGPMLGMALLLAPVVVVFWCIYTLVLDGTPKVYCKELTLKDMRAGNPFLITHSALAIGLALIVIFVLNQLISFIVAPVLEGETEHPALIWRGMLPSLIMVLWGTTVHFVALKNGCAALKHYILGFAVFVLGYALFDLMSLSGVLILVVLGLFAGEPSLQSSSSAPFWEQMSRYVAYSIFPVVVVAGAPVLWWAYHVAVPRICSAHPNA
ncbi:MAG: hypothetical protein OXF72_10875 [Gammaproteobacteria bacterium]|nr:hypothetical protein [Gammaproteobacteria bacterium]MCY4277527.1 hypothetical protein [Gammaproteobacteria bacterium]